MGEDKVFIVSFACNPKTSLGVIPLRINYSIDTLPESIHNIFNFYFLLIDFIVLNCYYNEVPAGTGFFSGRNLILFYIL